MKERLVSIATQEECTFTDQELDEILKVAGGDMRRAVTVLQSAHSLSSAGPLSNDDFRDLAGLPPENVVDSIWSNLTSFDRMQETMEGVFAEGYSSQALLTLLMQKTLEDPILSQISKAKMAIRIAEAEKNLIDGADEYLQLMTVCSLALQCKEQSRMLK
jgi:replication factor C subunit 2/4